MTLKFLVEEYEQHGSLLFVQEYAQEFALVLRQLKDGQHNAEYEQMLLVLLMENYRSNISALQYKFAHAIGSINESLMYWSAQEDNPFLYAFHKNPIKWFNKESSADEIQEHIHVLEEVLYKYTVRLGQLVNHSAMLPLHLDHLSCERMLTINQELYTICGDVVQGITQDNEKEGDEYKLFFKTIYMLSIEQSNIVDHLLQPIKAHEKPNHIERYWLQYITCLGLGIFLIKQKNNPASSVNRLMEKYGLVTYEKRFLESCKQNFVVPFHRLGNTLFGFPLDISTDYPAKFDPLVKLYNKGEADALDLAQKGYDKKPDDLDIHLLAQYPWPKYQNDPKVWQLIWNYLVPWPKQRSLPQGYEIAWNFLNAKLSDLKSHDTEITVPSMEWTTEQKEILFKSNKIIGYLLYMALRGKSDILLSFLNITYEIDLILKMIASIPAIALIYGGYKGIQHLYKHGQYANYKLIYAALIDLEQCIAEASLEKESTSQDTDDYMCGKLFFLKYRVKKIAAKLFGKSVYKAFAKDIQKIKLLKDHLGDYGKMTTIIMKKYNIEQRVNA
ncbi:MAG TPA: hypothetical protein VL201_02785 [Patescibacteria group bacterium]|nr:hypothetical protein [Patescibacteria group bacterium]